MRVYAISVPYFLTNYIVACLVMMFMLALIYECLMCLKL